VSFRSPLLENGAGRCGALVEQPVRLRLVRNLLLRQAMEGRPQASAQLLACGDPIAAGGGDEEDLGRRVFPELVGDGLDDVLGTDPRGGADAGAGERGEGDDEVVLSPFARRPGV